MLAVSGIACWGDRTASRPAVLTVGTDGPDRTDILCHVTHIPSIHRRHAGGEVSLPAVERPVSAKPHPDDIEAAAAGKHDEGGDERGPTRS